MLSESTRFESLCIQIKSPFGTKEYNLIQNRRSRLILYIGGVKVKMADGRAFLDLRKLCTGKSVSLNLINISVCQENVTATNYKCGFLEID